MSVTPTPIATSARIVYESGASWTMRGLYPAASHASTVASRRLDPVPGGEADEGLLGQVRDGDAALLRQRVVRGQRADQLLLGDHPVLHAGLGHRQPYEPQVQRAVRDPRQRAVGVGLAAHDEFDAGVGGPYGPGEPRQARVAGGTGEADADPPVLAASGGLGDPRRRCRCPPGRCAPASGTPRPALVSRTERVLRSKSWTPSSFSSCRICWLSGGCAICSRLAARPKCSSSATATKEER